MLRSRQVHGHMQPQLIALSCVRRTIFRDSHARDIAQACLALSDIACVVFWPSHVGRHQCKYM